jgi:general secretion pathway protein C
VATIAQALRLDGELASQLIAHAPRGVTALLVALLGVRAALLVADLSGGASTAPAPLPSPSTAATRNVVDIPSILRSNLFGQGAVAGSGNAPVTSMALTLAGVVADLDEKLGFAMLGTSAADIKFYRVGETLPGGARLHAVFVDHVLLDRGGTIETLPMPPRVGAGGPIGAPVAASAPSSTASAEQLQQLVRENPGIIGQVIRHQAVLADGRLRGMRVYPGANAQAFSRLGLRPGDLITAINGTPLEDQARGNEIFNTLNGSAQARVTVTRNNGQQELVLNLAEVATEAEKLAQAPPPGGLGQPAVPDSAR